MQGVSVGNASVSINNETRQLPFPPGRWQAAGGGRAAELQVDPGSSPGQHLHLKAISPEDRDHNHQCSVLNYFPHSDLYSVLSKCKASVNSKNIISRHHFHLFSHFYKSMSGCKSMMLGLSGWWMFIKMSISRHDTLRSPQLPAAAPIIASASARARHRAVQANIF